MNIKIRYENELSSVVYNELSIPKNITYQDNIKDILALENVLEELNNDYNDSKNNLGILRKKRNKMEKDLKKHKKRQIICLILQLGIFPLIMSILAFMSFKAIITTTLLHLLLTFLVGEVFLTINTLTIGHLFKDFKNNHEINELSKKINGYNIFLMAAKNLINIKNKELETLKDDRRCTFSEENKDNVEKINYQDKLLKEREYLKRMKRYGENDDYYQKLIHHPELLQKMHEKYEDEVLSRKRSIGE